MTTVWVILALVLGACVALQGALNASLSSRIGVGETLVVNTILVALGSTIVLLVTTGVSHLSVTHVLRAPWYEYAGGLLGFTIILLAMVLFPRLGAGLTLSLAITAQLAVALLIDQFALLGVPAHPITPARIVGVVMLAAGAVIVKMT